MNPVPKLLLCLNYPPFLLLNADTLLIVYLLFLIIDFNLMQAQPYYGGGGGAPPMAYSAGPAPGYGGGPMQAQPGIILVIIFMLYHNKNIIFSKF